MMRNAEEAMAKVLRLGILGSGKGSNFQAIARAIGRGELPGVEIAVVVSDVEDAPILAKARAGGFQAQYVPAGRYKTWLEPEAEARYVEALKAAGVDLVVLAGFMRVIKAPLLNAFAGRIVNMHPSLLPAFKGLAAWEQALKAGVRETGCTVHYVDGQLDGGPVVLQEKVAVLPGDTPQSLHARIQEKEHLLYPRAISLIAKERARGA